MSRMYDKARAAIRQHYIDLMDEKTKKLRQCALFDVNYGPMGAEYYCEAEGVEDWPGYVKAIDQLREWASENIQTTWFDVQAEFVQTDEPKGFEDEDGEWVEPAWEDYVKLDESDIRRAVFGDLVTSGGM
jgi:hypothetical protein